MKIRVICYVNWKILSELLILLLWLEKKPLFEFINDVIYHILEEEIFMRVKKTGFEKSAIEPQMSSSTFDDTYCVFGFRQLQTAFYLLLLGYVLVLACCVTEITWHRFRLKKR